MNWLDFLDSTKTSNILAVLAILVSVWLAKWQNRKTSQSNKTEALPLEHTQRVERYHDKPRFRVGKGNSWKSISESHFQIECPFTIGILGDKPVDIVRTELVYGPPGHEKTTYALDGPCSVSKDFPISGKQFLTVSKHGMLPCQIILQIYYVDPHLDSIEIHYEDMGTISHI